MQRILIATDGSAAANEAVELGVELAREEGAEVVFVHVVPLSHTVAMNGFGLMGYVPYEPTDWDEQVLEGAYAVAEHACVPAGNRSSCGATPPSRSSVTPTRSTQTSSSSGREGMARIASALLGSVSRRVLGASKRPVLVVRAAAVREPVVS